MVKNHKNVIDLSNESRWKIERRTRGVDAVDQTGKQTQTWVLVLTNQLGHKRFVHEHRIWEQYKPADA